jgi:hypothetical protein
MEPTNIKKKKVMYLVSACLVIGLQGYMGPNVALPVLAKEYNFM